MLRSKTANEYWNIIKYVIEGIVDKFVPLKKKQGTSSRKNNLSKEAIIKITSRQYGGFIGVSERMEIIQITKRHIMQL